ncbi:hypothetical protein B0H16DRAFT_1484812 [Mycena metata]|uniref:Ribonuclease H1 N-terminal domain-containing protein n=1 Tax=Mycena metata TaxID=1033252 RepID=A0AAD7GP93_9AGAR|nr:hypothetical protein B0H16DRAFT_1484812 [Mycena metata]
MAPYDLTTVEITTLLQNHPERLSLQELENLLSHLTTSEAEDLLGRLGLETFAPQLPPILNKVITAAQRIMRNRPPKYDDEINVILTPPCSFATERSYIPYPPLFSGTEITPADDTSDSAGSSGSSAAVLQTPNRPRFLTSPPAPTLPVCATPRSTGSHIPSAPTTPARTTPCSTTSASTLCGYIVDSPSKKGLVVNWLEAGSLTNGVRGASVHSTGRKSRKPRAHAWAVFYGGKVAVFTEWAATQHSITGHGLAIYAGFPSVAAASATLEYARAQGWTGDLAPPSGQPPATFALPSAYDDNPLNSGAATNLWYAVSRGIVPGVYRSYLECSLNTSGVQGNLCASFATCQEAESAFMQAHERGLVRCLSRNPA